MNKSLFFLGLAMATTVSAMDKAGLTSSKLARLNKQLCDAAEGGTWKKVLELIDSGADASAPHREYLDTPLHWAAYHSRADMMRELLRRGADIEARDFLSRTPLNRAAPLQADLVHVLIEHGADVNAKTKSGWTPLQSALASNEKATVKLLLDAGADEAPWDA